jgi:hypothetical protein
MQKQNEQFSMTLLATEFSKLPQLSKHHNFMKLFANMSRSAFAVTLTCSLVVSQFAYAADYSSANFLVRDSNTEEFGGTSTSTSFESLGSGNDIAQTEASSTSFLLNTGPMFFETFEAFSQNWRWYDDAENETPSVPLADEETAPTNTQNGNVIKLRMTIVETAGIAAEGHKFRLQFSTSSTFSDHGTFVDEVGVTCTGISEWCYALGGGIDNGVISTALLSDPDLCVGGVGDGCGTHNESGTSTTAFVHASTTAREYEFTITASGAIPNTVYFFRAFDNAGNVAILSNTGESYPSLSTSGSTLTFSIDGVASTTATEGIVTDIDTTPTGVSFGELLMNTSVEAAHRLTVTTNATQGYKIYTLQRQGFLGSSGGEIDPVTGTNETPLGWTTGCSSGAGCYGYHAGDDLLDGIDPVRFAANDKYAGFTSAPKEVAYSPGPVNDETTDIVYKVEARSLQEAGSYEGNILFIVAPVF